MFSYVFCVEVFEWCEADVAGCVDEDGWECGAVHIFVSFDGGEGAVY